MARLGTSSEGLSSAEAAARLRTHEANELVVSRLRSKVAEFLRAVLNPLVVILLVAGTASAFLGEVGDAATVVFATGQDISFGDIVERLAARPEETEFERGTRHFGMLILRAVTFLVLFILIVNLSLGRDAMQSLLFSVALAVGLTPEFLPMITTVTLAQGAIRMAREKVIVKHLPSIQKSIDILCSDKTGTLTAGTMSLDASLDPHGRPSPRAVFLGHLNSQFESWIKSPLDAAILARDAPGTDGFEKTDEIPFDFERRRLSIVVEKDGSFLLVTKGAPEGVLAACTSFEIDGSVHALDPPAREKWGIGRTSCVLG